MGESGAKGDETLLEERRCAYLTGEI